MYQFSVYCALYMQESFFRSAYWYTFAKVSSTAVSIEMPKYWFQHDAMKRRNSNQWVAHEVEVVNQSSFVQYIHGICFQNGLIENPVD